MFDLIRFEWFFWSSGEPAGGRPLIFRSQQEFEQEIILQYREGRGIRWLARRFGISRNTVRGIIRQHERQRTEPPPLPSPRPSKLDPFKQEIAVLLEKTPDLSAVRVQEELRPLGYDGGLTILRDYLRQVRRPCREPHLTIVTEPGQQGQMDWTSYRLEFTRAGREEVLCFSYILGFSRRQFIDFTRRRDFFTLIRRHQDAFAWFGGVPRECLYDNEKTVVLRWEMGRPVFNPAFTAFITHYGCRPIACRPGRAQTKGKVERPFQYVEGNLLAGRRFEDLDDLRAFAVWWMRERSDLHVHDTTGRPPIELFREQEADRLQPLPAIPYDSAEVALVIGRADGFVEFETNKYSIPSGYLADLLTLKADEQTVRIYSQNLELVATHERAPAGARRRVEDPSHHRTKRERYGLEPLREAILALGPAAAEFLAGLEKRQPRNAGFHARFILDLRQEYAAGDIHRALQHALRYQAFDGKAIERILQARAQPRTLEHVRQEQARATLRKALPKVEQRPLADYTRLLETIEEEEDEHHDGPDSPASGHAGPEGDGEGSR
jgi:transposase